MIDGYSIADILCGTAFLVGVPAFIFWIIRIVYMGIHDQIDAAYHAKILMNQGYSEERAWEIAVDIVSGKGLDGLTEQVLSTRSKGNPGGATDARRAGSDFQGWY